VGGDDADVLVLELVEGITLRQAMDRGLAYEEKLEIAEQLAAALAAAHGLGIIHRDLKPTNVMRTPGGVVKVLDFDLARFVTEGEPAAEEPAADAPDGESTDAGTIVGTAAYMSPEQARGEPLTVASDLYTLGILLHELFLGVSPYGEERPLRARLLQVASGETEPARGLDPELMNLVESLKRLQPEARPAAAEAARCLHALRMEPIRQRRLLLLAAVALVAGLVLAIPVAHKLAGERPLAAPVPRSGWRWSGSPISPGRRSTTGQRARRAAEGVARLAARLGGRGGAGRRVRPCGGGVDRVGCGSLPGPGDPSPRVGEDETLGDRGRLAGRGGRGGGPAGGGAVARSGG
jgi:hypothetical protein